MNIAFFSSSFLALSLLEKLNGDFAVKLVITNPDKPIGRKQILTPSVLKTWAIQNKVEFLTPISLKTPTINETMKQLSIDLAIVIDYGLLIPKSVFTAPKFETINIHFSLLPKYRGPNPDAFVILNGEKRTGISFVLINEGFDTGDILAQKEVGVLPNETAGELHQRLYRETEKIITYIIDSWVRWQLDNKNVQLTINNEQLKLFLPPINQNNKSATYTKKLQREDGFISWEILKKVLGNEEISNDELPDLINCHCEERSDEAISKTKQIRLPRPAIGGARNDICLHNFYRALSPWPGMWTEIKITTSPLSPLLPGEGKGEVKRLKILKAHLEKEKFVIDEVQLEGKNPISWKQFCEAYKH